MPPPRPHLRRSGASPRGAQRQGGGDGARGGDEGLGERLELGWEKELCLETKRETAGVGRGAVDRRRSCCGGAVVLGRVSMPPRPILEKDPAMDAWSKWRERQW